MKDLDKNLEVAEEILKEVSKTVIGKDEVIRKILMAILAGGHILINDIPGVGKTTMTLAFASTLGLKCNRMQFTPDVMPSDVIGFNMYNRVTNTFEYQEGAVMCNILLADEINRTLPKTQSALLQVMEEGTTTVDGVTRQLPDPFIVLATQNPYGSIGTQKLPESQLDRFMACLSLGYPTVDDEIQIMRAKQKEKERIHSKKIIGIDELQAMREIVKNIYVGDAIYEYVAQIAKATRNSPEIIQGVSPRGSIAIIAMARAEAFLRGHDYVLPADVQNVLPETMAHRLVLDQGRGRDLAPENAVKRIMEHVKVPEIKNGKA